jgi:hypothetical protein
LFGPFETTSQGTADMGNQFGSPLCHLEEKETETMESTGRERKTTQWEIIGGIGGVESTEEDEELVGLSFETADNWLANFGAQTERTG